MQNSDNDTAKNPCRSRDFNKQPSTGNSIQRTLHNPRFAVTPESLGMNSNSHAPTSFNRQQSQSEPPLVEVKSYYERHNKLPVVGTLADLKQESNNSLQNSQSNVIKNSYGSIKTETIGQSSSNYCTSNKPEYTIQQSISPNVSPKTSAQQWNFDGTIKTETYEPENNIFTSTALLCPAIGKNSNDSSNLQSSQPLATVYDASRSQCVYVQNVSPITDTTQMSSYEEQWLKSRSGSDVCVGDAAKLNFKELNDIFLKRIEHIDSEVGGDKDLKIVTYQEWVEMLTKVSESFITNMDELEREVADRLKLVQTKVSSNCRHSQGNELMKCRKDIGTLLKYIQNARNYNIWDLQDLQFETITPAQVLDMGDYDHLTIEGHGNDGMKNCNEADVMQRNKLFANMKALAHEVAEKHDEVRELKRQIICLEDEIQKAQKKIQLKDDVIKELRNDLKCANNKISSPVLDNGLVMPPINFDNQTSRSSNTHSTDCNTPIFHEDNGSQFDSLSRTELEEQQKVKILEEEINDFFKMNTELNKQQMENHRKKLMDIFQKLESEKAAAYRKLDFIRRQLIDLEADSVVERNIDCDSGFHSKNENDNDAKILDAVRKRLSKLNETNVELKKKLQKLELHNNELENNLQTEKSFSQCNSETLKEIADLLSSMTGKQFLYTDIYNKTQSTVNPFCETIMNMKNEFQERECQLLKTIGLRNRGFEELSQSLLENEKMFNEERATHWNTNSLEDINKTPTCNTKATGLIQNVTNTTTGTSTPEEGEASVQTTLTGQNLEDNHTKMSCEQ